MPFIGNQPALSYTSFAKQDFTTSATTSYTLDNSVANANELALFINFVRQEPTTAYSASGTTLTLTEATSSSDDMYCVYLGKAVQTVTPASGSVTNAMLGETITVAKGGTGLTSGFANGITEADQFRLTASLTSNADPISANLERVDDATFAKIGTGMSLSSGVYTFPTTGLYKVESTASLVWVNDPDSIQVEMYASSDSGSNYDIISRIEETVNVTGVFALSFSNSAFVNVTNASTFRVKFVLTSLDANNYLSGVTDYNLTFFTFTRLGDSQ